MSMRRLELGTIKLPRIYVVDTRADANECREAGIPYIVWRGSHEELVKLVLYPTLKKMFPGIKWTEVLNISGKKQTIVNVPGSLEPEEKFSDEGPTFMKSDIVQESSGLVDSADSVREFSNGGIIGTNKMKIDEYIGDLSATVNIEELQALHLLPSFLDEITNNIKRNLYNLAWWEGYNKKRGYPAGNFDGGSESPNLIILDISGSIPRSIAATMLTLIDTLRHQANADLIITAAKSEFYPMDTKLPTPQELRQQFSLGNEAKMFYEILRTQIKGRKFSNVISFGDYDCPVDYERYGLCKTRGLTNCDLEGTVVHEVWHYHTCSDSAPTGYAMWADDICEKTHHNRKWCSMMYNNQEARRNGLMGSWM